MLHVLGLGGGLEGVVPVQVIAAGGVPGDIRSALDVLLGDEDEEHVGQQLVLDVYSVALHGVILFKVDLAGLAVVVSGQVAEVAGLILDEVGNGDAALRSDRPISSLSSFSPAAVKPVSVL